ncbi:Multiple C2 and transmembrane domain-containing protein 1 [Hypsibius exemplaris]|uniref:Multiple C2 and transmembrane domain-containing protein 1 n=1 Tax=Hypsibius exemplaris TaxID=2072580 RepID=A0A9X6NDB4_HYPEX|nr:Multiple C2 and transmembrane domain-containing protein 1 [Hypsibius exemplaris]
MFRSEDAAEWESAENESRIGGSHADEEGSPEMMEGSMGSLIPPSKRSPKRRSAGLLSRFGVKRFFSKTTSVDAAGDDVDSGAQDKKPSADQTTRHGIFSKEGRSRSFPNLLQLINHTKPIPAEVSAPSLSPGGQTNTNKVRRSKSVPKGAPNLLAPLGQTVSLDPSTAGNNSFLSALSDSPPSQPANGREYHVLHHLKEDLLAFASPASSSVSVGLMSAKDLSLNFSESGDAGATNLSDVTISRPPNNVPVEVQTEATADDRKPEPVTRVNSAGNGRAVSSVPSGGGSSKQSSWVNSVTIFLYEGKDLPAMDRNGFSDPFCKFKLGATEKHRSRTAYKTLNPAWMEQFDMFVYDERDKRLEISVWDWDRGVRNDFIGSAAVDLAGLESERQHDLWLNIDDGHGASCGALHMSIMISGKKLITAAGEGAVPGDAVTGSSATDSGVVNKYGLRHSLADVKDVGTLTVKVFKGSSLKAADLNGKSDPYCILRLVNARKQTEVELKTLDPEWNREFSFLVQDVHSVLEITVLDMDQDNKSDFLGRVAIPLLNIKNHERRWYALKDDKLMGRSKGSILLEMDLVYNPLRAAIRTINPRESRLDEIVPKFRRQLFVRNMTRLRGILQPFLDIAQYVQSCFAWQSRRRSITAFLVYMTSVYMFEIWMLPVVLLAFLVKHYIKQELVPTSYARDLHTEEMADNDDDSLLDDEDDMDGDPNRGPAVITKTASSNNIVQKVRQAQEQLRTMQNILGFLADLCERMYNMVHFTVPWLSYYAMIVCTVVAIILYLIPLRVILLIWGVHKFTKKLRNPNALGNNEILDFLSRVHTHAEAGKYKELRPRDVPAVYG